MEGKLTLPPSIPPPMLCFLEASEVVRSKDAINSCRVSLHLAGLHENLLEIILQGLVGLLPLPDRKV
jgi:hypothetical protein